MLLAFRSPALYSLRHISRRAMSVLPVGVSSTCIVFVPADISPYHFLLRSKAAIGFSNWMRISTLLSPMSIIQITHATPYDCAASGHYIHSTPQSTSRLWLGNYTYWHWCCFSLLLLLWCAREILPWPVLTSHRSRRDDVFDLQDCWRSPRRVHIKFDERTILRSTSRPILRERNTVDLLHGSRADPQPQHFT